jgi:hypothetical protein
MPTQYADDISLGQAIFGEVPLGDSRRTDRLVATFDRLRRHPGGTLPDKLSSPADLRALYRLCSCELVTHAVLVAAMRAYTLEQIAAHKGSVLVVHDWTEPDFTTLKTLEKHLGQIGNGRYRGYVCHNVVAIDASTGQVLGLLDQILHCRDEVPKKESLDKKRNRKTRESLLWVKGTAHLPADRRLIDMADQGASTFEFLEHESKSGRRFIVRNGKSRKCYPGHKATEEFQYLKPYVESLPDLQRFTMSVQPQKKRKARKEAWFTVRGGPVLVLPPHAKCGHHGDDPLPLYVVYVREEEPPKGEKRLEWVLLTNEPVHTGTDAWRVVTWYERRWVVEEYHKAMKTGCQIEDLQFSFVDRLQPAIALLSALALTLLNLRDVSRSKELQDKPATDLFDREYVEVLSLRRHREKRDDLTVEEFFLALARLGGHQNRKCDHPPGWLIIWRGWTKLQLMLDGYELAKKKCGQT